MFKFREYKFKSFSLGIITLILCFGGVGMFLIQRLQDADERQFEKQLLGYAAGIVIMLVVATIDYHFICKLFIPLYVFNMGLLLFCKFTDKTMGLPIYGDRHYTAKRWIEISAGGRSIEFMPSELSKIIMILFLAKLFELLHKKVKKFYVLVLATVLMAIPTYLIMDQPDLSTTIVMVAFFAVMVFAAGASYKHLIPIAIGVAAFLRLFFWGINHGLLDLLIKAKMLTIYQGNRILSFIHPELYPDEMYQQENAVVAIRSGGMFGKLITGDTGTRASNLVPVVESDFIFSAIGEEFGFVGMLLIIAGFLLFAYLGLRIALRAKDYLGMLVATGITALITIQAFVNMGVVTSMLPNTGIPLPFISSGLSSLLCTLMIIGILLNVSIQPKAEESVNEIIRY